MRVVARTRSAVPGRRAGETFTVRLVYERGVTSVHGVWKMRSRGGRLHLHTVEDGRTYSFPWADVRHVDVFRTDG